MRRPPCAKPRQSSTCTVDSALRASAQPPARLCRGAMSTACQAWTQAPLQRRAAATAARARLSYGGHTVEFSCAHPRRHAGEGARERAAELQRERVQTKVICRRRWHAAVLVCLASSEKASPCRSGHRAASASLYRPGAKPKKRSKSKKQAVMMTRRGVSSLSVTRMRVG